MNQNEQTRQRLPAGVVEDELGRPLAPLNVLVPYEDNPRDPDDFDPAKTPSFAALVNSIEEVGVREAINVYPCGDDKLCMQSGHRRRMAVILINARRDEAYAARVKLGELKPGDPRPDDLVPIFGLPISMSHPPKTPFDLEADMWLSESQREKWPADRMFGFYKSTFDAASEYLRDDLAKLAGRLGLPQSRVKTLTTIVTSEVLFAAATEHGPDALPDQGREKTMRSISRVADVIYHDRWSAAVKATGLYKQDTNTLEAVRVLVVAKAKEYASSKIPAGVALERTAPELRKEDVYPDDVVVAWLTGPGTIAERVLPTTVKGVKESEATPAAPIDENSPRDAEDLLVVSARYKDLDFTEMTTEDLNRLVGRLTQVTDTLDLLLTAARSQRRSRVG